MQHCDRLLNRIANRTKCHFYGPASVIGSTISTSSGTGTGAAIGGLLSNPVTAIIGAGLGIVQLIFGIRAHHAAAVKNEAAALTSASAAVTDTYKGLFTGVTSGQITPIQASNAVDSIFPAYEKLVYQDYKVKKKSGNGPDKIEQQLRDWATAFKNWLNGHDSSVTLEALDRHGDWKGQAAITLTGTVPVAPTPAVASTTGTAGVPSFLQKYWLLIVAVIILFYVIE